MPTLGRRVLKPRPVAHKGNCQMIIQQTEASQTTRLQLALAWSFAGIPLLAGVIQTLINAMKLFQ